MGIVVNSAKTVPDDVKEMITLYSELIKTRRRMEAGADEKVRYSKLEIKVNALWLVLDRDKQLQAVRALVKDDFMDPLVAEVLVMFEGKIDEREPAEPCLRFKL